LSASASPAALFTGAVVFLHFLEDRGDLGNVDICEGKLRVHLARVGVTHRHRVLDRLRDLKVLKMAFYRAIALMRAARNA
jgi:hypothetical protein